MLAYVATMRKSTPRRVAQQTRIKADPGYVDLTGDERDEHTRWIDPDKLDGNVLCREVPLRLRRYWPASPSAPTTPARTVAGSAASAPRIWTRRVFFTRASL